MVIPEITLDIPMPDGVKAPAKTLSPNYQHIAVSKTLFKRLVNHGALCSECGLPVNIHGGHMPCHGAETVVDAEVLREVNIGSIVKASL